MRENIVVDDLREIQSINDLKNALGEVYTQSYIKVLENTALNGATSDDVSISAKFVEKDGKLYVNPESTEHFGEPTELDLSTAKVARSSRFKAEVTVERDGETFYILLEKYDGEWLIDSSILVINDHPQKGALWYPGHKNPTLF